MSDTMYAVMKLQQPINKNDELSGFIPVYSSREKAEEIAGEKYRVWPVNSSEDDSDDE